MADSDSQGEDLPPFTPFTSACEEPADLEDLPEYTPFTDPQKPSAPHSAKPEPEMAVEEVEDVVVVESEFVQEMVVAAEAPGESFDFREEQREAIVREGESELPTYSPIEGVEETISSQADISTPVEEQKVQVEEEGKPPAGKKPRKHKGGKGQEADSPPEPSSKEETTQVQPHQPQKPANDSVPPQREETKTGPPSAKEGVAVQQPSELVSEPRPALPGSKDRKKARSGRPAGVTPSTEEPKAAVPEDSAVLEEAKEAFKVPPSEEIEEEKPKQHTLPAQRQKKLRSDKPPGPMAPSEDTQETFPVPQPKQSPEQREPTAVQRSAGPKETPASLPGETKQAPAPAHRESSAPAKVQKPTTTLNHPKEQPQASTPAPQLPAEETKKPLPQAKAPTQPAPVADTPKASEPVPRQPGLSAKARKNLRDVKQPESATQAVAKPTPAEVPKPASSKPDPRLLDLEKQVHLTTEKQQSAKLLTAKLLQSMEENKAKKERVERQVEKAKQTLAQLSEELAKSAAIQEGAKAENQLKQLKVRVRVLTEDLEDKETDFAARRATREAHEMEIRDIRNRRKRLEEEKKAITKANSEAVSESESYQSEIKRLEALIKKANETIQQMKDSFSSRDLESTLKSFISKRTAKARNLGEREGRIHSSYNMLETERHGYIPDLATGSGLGSSKLAKQIGEVEWELRSKTEEVERLRGELGTGAIGCCPLLFLLIGLLLGVLVQRLV